MFNPYVLVLIKFRNKILTYICSFFFTEKRQSFDAGEDPLDPEDQQGGRGSPFFHEGFDPFGSGGFSFKFNFN